ncbi:MAG: ABC transporter permease [Muribaculaceae bacterium]|nr:ABC transporter permease [Muribaculaceae bacterium]MDE6612770.1 ABC transporter permease [Muribaculaceae bacterium]
MKFLQKISHSIAGMGRVFRNEFRLIFSDIGVMLFFLALPLAYPVVYTLIYNPEVVRKLPVAVVDNSMTAASRDLVRKAGASPSIEIYAYCPNMADAKDLMADGKVYGIMEIPDNYSQCIGRGEQAHVAFFADMSLLLRYRTFVAALTDLQLELTSSITGERIASTGLESLTGGSSGMPIASESNFLGDTEQGFASFVIPGIVILIIQQSMLLGICLIGGTSRERRRSGSDTREVQGVSAFATIWGKTLAVTVLYIPLTIYVMRFIPEMFNLPHYGRPVDYMLFIFPMLIATAFLGQTLVYFMKERESAFITIVFTSVIFLFLSGLTWPRYAMSDLWYWIGNCVPAVWGVEGFIRINSNAASLPETGISFHALWILAAVYMLTAWWVTAKLKLQRD